MTFGMFRRRKRTPQPPVTDPETAAAVERIERGLYDLAQRFSAHATEVDVKLELYAVVVPKILTDVTQAMREHTAATRRLTETLEAWHERQIAGPRITERSA